MRKIVATLLLYFIVYNVLSQNGKGAPAFNLGFEQISSGAKFPDGWFRWGTDDYTIKIDSSIKHTGKASMLIESTKSFVKGSFGCIAYAIPADYLGKEIEVRAYLRVQDIMDSEAGLLLRIDDKNRNVLEMENGHQKNIHGSGYWNYYSVSLPFPPKAKTIYIGAMLSGTGKVWVDDFQVLIDGKDISKAKHKAKIELKADRDHEFDGGSRIPAISLSPLGIETLYVTGKIWGFLKYHHPAIAKGNYNWDYELFRILPELLKCSGKVQRNTLLSNWIDMLGDVNSNLKLIKPDSNNVKLYPDIDWISDTTELGSKLSEQLKEIKDAKRPEDHYYLDLTTAVGNPEFTNENTYDTINYPDAGFQLLSLYRYWNIIQYYYPYKNLLQGNWNDALKQYMPRFVNASTELEYKLAVLSLIGRIRDGNANIMAPNPVVSAFKGNNRVPVDVNFVENKVVVTAVFKNEQITPSKLVVGDVIIKINDKPVEQIIKERMEYTPASNDVVQLRNLGVDLLRTNDSVLKITYERNSSIETVSDKCYPRDWLFRLKNLQKKDTCFKPLMQDIVYINTASLKNNYLEKAMPNIFKTKGVIIDLRGYPLESYISTLGEYLTPSLRPFAKHTRVTRSVPGLFTFSENRTIGGGSRRQYKGKVVVLINEATQGAGEYHAMAFKASASVRLLGSATAGANGNLSDIYLPGGIRTLISGVGVYFPDGKETQGVGIQPDIVAIPTIKGIAEGRDELIEKAIELINK